MNAAGVLKIPLAIAVWDDGFGISVPTAKQTIKASISKALGGFEKNQDDSGILIYQARGGLSQALHDVRGRDNEMQEGSCAGTLSCN